MKFEKVGLNICSPDPSERWEQTMGMYTWRLCKPAAERSPGQQTECRYHSNSSQAAMVGCLPPGSIRSETGQQVAHVTLGGNGDYQHLRDQPARYTARWQPVLPLTESRAEGKLQGQLLLLSQADHVTDVAENPTGNLSTTKISPRPRHMEYLRKSTSTNGDNEEKKWRNLHDTTKLVEQSKQALKTRTQFPYPQATSPSPASHCKPFLNWALPR